MQRPAKLIDGAAISRATMMAREWMYSHLKTAEKIHNDTDRDRRKAEQLCATCFYLRKGSIAGQAITVQPCGLCAAPQTYSSTATDALCMGCAIGHCLCKKCGADVELKQRTAL